MLTQPEGNSSSKRSKTISPSIEWKRQHGIKDLEHNKGLHAGGNRHLGGQPQHTITTFANVPQAAGGPAIGASAAVKIAAKRPWKNVNPSIAVLKESGGRCKMWCDKLSFAIKGKPIHIFPKPRTFVTPGEIGPVRTKAGKVIATNWKEHFAVLKHGRIYDRITGPKGLSPEEYMKLCDYLLGRSDIRRSEVTVSVPFFRKG